MADEPDNPAAAAVTPVTWLAASPLNAQNASVVPLAPIASARLRADEPPPWASVQARLTHLALWAALPGVGCGQVGALFGGLSMQKYSILSTPCLMRSQYSYGATLP